MLLCVAIYVVYDIYINDLYKNSNKLKKGLIN